jgi:L-lactate dehydrogenase complex protein LldG
MERDAFIARLSSARPGPPLPDVSDLPAVHTELRAGEQLYDRFAHELTAVKGTCERRPAAEVGAAVAAALGGARRVALGGDLRDQRAAVDAGLAAAGITAIPYAEAVADRAVLGALEATVTGCALAVAATGSIVVSASAGRAAALIAPLHVCVVGAGQLVGGLAEALRTLPPGSLTAFQSGPSRTADIEKVLILGMHGPGATHVIVVH